MKKNNSYRNWTIFLALLLLAQLFILKILYYPDIIEKPVLYLYPTENTSIKVKFEHLNI